VKDHSDIFFNLLKGLTSMSDSGLDKPFMSKYPDLEYSYLIELKYIARGEYSEEVQQEKIQDAQEQLDQYVKSDRVKKSIAGTQLIKIILVYKGWELTYCEEYA